MYFLSCVVIGIIVVGLIAAYLSEMYLTQILIIQNILIFMIVFIPALRYPFVLKEVVIDLAGMPMYLQTGEKLYTLFTLMFLHGGFLHIIGNVLILFFIGIPLEDRIGKKNIAIVYFSTGLMATMGQFSFQFAVGWGLNIPNLGASGAIMGLMGTMVYLYPKDKIPMFLGPIFMPEVRVDLAVAVFIMLQTVIAFMNPYGQTAHAAHFTGFGFGMALAPLLRRYITREKTAVKRDYSKLEKLATDEKLEKAYEKIEGSDEEEMREAWAEYILNKAECPECGGNLDDGGCECGFDMWED